MPKNINIKGSIEINKRLNELIKKASQNYVIKVGIMGEAAAQKQEGTDLNMAELGAVHEFGATIEHPGGQPYYINSSTGKAVFVKKDSFLGKFLIAKGQVTKPHTIIIPTRSFLRMPLLASSGKAKILKDAINSNEVLSEYMTKVGSKDENTQIYAQAIKKHIDAKTLENLPYMIAAAALKRVNEAFESGGFGKWKPITNYTKEHRKGSPDNPPLEDLGNLKDSITVQVKKV